MKLSIVIPCYNEAKTIVQLLETIHLTKLPKGLNSEIIVVDDGSTDNTLQLLKLVKKPLFKLIKHKQNKGKGSAIRTGFTKASGDIVLIQDADLEYNPREYPSLVKPFLKKKSTQVVYGSRELGRKNRVYSYLSFYLGGLLVTQAANLLYGLKLTDEPTGYKLFRREVLKSLNLTCEGFEFCSEVTAKLARKKIPIIEVPISYKPRSLNEGKKIRFNDGLMAIWILLNTGSFMFKKYVIIGVFLVAVFGLILLVAQRVVPVNMDEFSLYHVLACKHYSLNSLNTFRVGCDTFDIRLPGTNSYLPIREYTYMGGVTSLYYWPLFLVWPQPVTTRLVGLLLLCVEAWLLSRITKQRFAILLTGLILFFPYFFQHLIDTGVVGFQVTLILLYYYNLQQWVKQRRLVYPILLSLLLGIGIFTKFTFIWFIPGLGLLTVWEWWTARKKMTTAQWRSIVLQSLLAGLFLSLFLGTYFFSTDRQGEFVYREFFADSRDKVASIKDFFFFFHPSILSHSPIVKALLNPLESTQRIYEVGPASWLEFSYSSLVLLLVPLLLAHFWLRHPQHRQGLRQPMVLYAVFWITLLMIYRTGRAWSFHHVVLAFPFLVLSFLYLLQQLLRRGEERLVYSMLLIFALGNVYYFLAFSRQPVKASDDPSKVEINAILMDPYLANKYIYVMIDWGMYYYQSLYGHKSQSVLYVEPLDDLVQIETLKQLVEQHGRQLLFVYNTEEMMSDLSLLKKQFDLKPCKLVDASWVWQVALEADTKQQLNPCLQESL